MNPKALSAALIGAWIAILIFGAVQSNPVGGEADNPVARTALGML